LFDNQIPSPGFYWITSKGTGVTLAKFKEDAESCFGGAWHVIGMSSPIPHRQMSNHYQLIEKLEPPKVDPV